MTLERAKAVYRELSKKKTWTKSEREAMRDASQVIRYARRRRNPRQRKSNPCGNPRATVIYGRVLKIEAQKTQKHVCDVECKRCNHCYTHTFKSGAVMWGLPNGDILIRSGAK